MSATEPLKDRLMTLTGAVVLSEDQREDFEERAGIMEFCGGLDRAEAESQALRVVLGQPLIPRVLKSRLLGVVAIASQEGDPRTEQAALLSAKGLTNATIGWTMKWRGHWTEAEAEAFVESGHFPDGFAPF